MRINTYCHWCNRSQDVVVVSAEEAGKTTTLVCECHGRTYRKESPHTIVDSMPTKTYKALCAKAGE